jgi:hypothetical protein
VALKVNMTAMDFMYEPTNDGYWSFSDEEEELQLLCGNLHTRSQPVVVQMLKDPRPSELAGAHDAYFGKCLDRAVEFTDTLLHGQCRLSLYPCIPS